MSSSEVTGNALEEQPELEFRISVRRQPGHVLDNSRLAISPKAAASYDEDVFLEFAREVEKVRQKVLEARAQMELPL